MKGYLISNTEIEIHLGECLDSTGNNTEGHEGFRDKIKAYGLTWNEAKGALKKSTATKPIKSFGTTILTKTIESLNFEALRTLDTGEKLDKVALKREQFKFTSKKKVKK